MPATPTATALQSPKEPRVVELCRGTAHARLAARRPRLLEEAALRRGLLAHGGRSH
jgi:hypothetical protein